MSLFNKAGVNRELFFLLLISSVLATIASLPYILSLSTINAQQLPPLPLLVFAVIIQAVILFSIAIFVGLFLGRKVGLGAPFIEARLKKESTQGRFVSVLKISVLLGVLVGILLFILDRYIFTIFVEPITASQAEPPLWQRFLVSFYGGIGEEIIMRLFLMTLIVWISYKIKRNKAGMPTNLGIWFAIILVSIIFGLGHLPMTAQLQQITSLIVFRAIILNGIAGVVFGWLYWKKGLESAIISHFSTDIILHVILPTLL